MKAQERHHLKQNEFAATVARVTQSASENRDRLLIGLVAVVAIVAVAGGYLWWRGRTQGQAGAMLGVAMSMYQAPIVPAPTVPGAAQTPGTFPNEKARSEAALAAFQQVADTYPSTRAGLSARYHAASTLLSLDRTADAERAFQAVLDRAGSSVFGPMSRMGLAETYAAAGQFDKSIKAYEDLAAQRDGKLPVDGVLMQLARVYLQAGKPQEAKAAFKRVVDGFPESPYAQKARQEMTLLN